MSISYTGDDRPKNIQDQTDVDLTTVESSSFAPVPAWERGKKRRGGAGPAVTPMAATHSPVSSDAVEPSRRPDPLGEPSVLTTRPTLDRARVEEAPVSYERKVAKRDNSMPLIIGAGVLTLATLGAAGWYATQPRDGGVAELTPGTTATVAAPLTAETTTLAATPTAAPPITQVPIAAPQRAVTPTWTAAVSRARPLAAAAASPTAAQAGIDASGTATLPTGPQAYSGSAAPAPVVDTPAPLATPPVASEPAPAIATPEVIN